MYKKAFFMFLLAGCIKHPVETAGGTPGIYNFAGSNFTSTNSPCMDGVIVALDHACAVPMEIEQDTEYVMLQCQQVREGAQPWNEYNIVAITNPHLEDPVDMTMMCVDPYIRIYVRQRP